MKNIIYSLTGAYYSGESRLPVDVMKELGIKYQHAVSQTMGGVIQFYCCENIPKELPSFLKEFKRDNDFQGSVGYGLSQEDADRLDNFVDKV